jgi:GAF domain-containing protein
MPPVFQDDEEKTRIAGILNVIIWIVLVAALAGMISLSLLSEWGNLVVTIFGVVTLAFTGFVILLRLGYVRVLGVAVPLALWIGVSIPSWLYDGIQDTAVIGYFLVIIVVGLVAAVPVLTSFVLLSVLSAIAMYVAEAVGLIEGAAGEPPVSDVVFLTIALSAAGALLRAVVGRIAQESERARKSAQALAESNSELQANRDALAAQTQILERRARYLQASAVVAQEATASVSDFSKVLGDVAKTVGEQFGFYHVGLFLLESSGEWVKLQAASSRGGTQLIAQGYRLSLDAHCVVCQAVRQGKYCLARGTEDDEIPIQANTYLPDTRSELALPLQVGREIIGVLDIHSAQVDAFTDEDIAALQALAGQIVLAISNARLFQQVQASIEAERQAFGDLSRQAWQDLLRAQPDLGYLSDAQGERSAADVLEPQMEEVLQTGARAIEESIVSIPIRLRGDVIGVVDGRKPDGSTWSMREVELLEAMTEQLNVALESARLYQDTQRRAVREQLFSQVSERIRQELDLEAVLKTSVDQIQQVLGLEQATIRLVRDMDQDKVTGG